MFHKHSFWSQLPTSWHKSIYEKSLIFLWKNNLRKQNNNLLCNHPCVQAVCWSFSLVFCGKQIAAVNNFGFPIEDVHTAGKEVQISYIVHPHQQQVFSHFTHSSFFPLSVSLLFHVFCIYNHMLPHCNLQIYWQACVLERKRMQAFGLPPDIL